jgi:hypothetical protein
MYSNPDIIRRKHAVGIDVCPEIVQTMTVSDSPPSRIYGTWSFIWWQMLPLPIGSELRYVGFSAQILFLS